MLINLVGYVVMAGLIVISLGLIYRLVVNPKNWLDGSKRILAALLGFFIFFSARGANISISDFLFFSVDKSGGLFANVFFVFAPAIVGAIVTFYIFKIIGEISIYNSNVIYFIISFATMMIFGLIDSFLSGIGAENNKNVLINSSFIVGILTVFIFDKDANGALKKIYRGQENSAEKSDEENWRDKL